MKQRILKYFAVYLGGIFTVLIAMTILMLPSLIESESAFDNLSLESENIEAKVEFKVHGKIDAHRFLGLDTLEIIDDIEIQDQSYREGLKSLFQSGIPTELEFSWEEDDRRFRQSFQIIKGVGSQPVWSFSSSNKTAQKE